MNILTGNATDEKLLKEWKTLWEESSRAHIYNSPAWFLACLETFKYPEMLVLSCYNESKLVAILPLVKTKKFGLKAYQSPGGNFLDKSTFLSADGFERSLTEIIEHLSSVGSFYLTEVENSLIGALPPSGQLCYVVESSVCPYLDLDPDPYRYISHDNKRKILRIIKREASGFKYSIKFGDVENQVGIMTKIESESQKRAQFKDIFSDGFLMNLYVNINNLIKDSFAVNILFYKDKPICYRYGFVTKNKFGACNTAYVLEYKDLAPGKVLAYFMLQGLLELGIKTVDFSRGSSAFKKEFTPFSYKQYSLFYSRNVMVLSWWKAINTLMSALQSNPQIYDIFRKIKNKVIRGVNHY